MASRFGLSRLAVLVPKETGGLQPLESSSPAPRRPFRVPPSLRRAWRARAVPETDLQALAEAFPGLLPPGSRVFARSFPLAGRAGFVLAALDPGSRWSPSRLEDLLGRAAGICSRKLGLEREQRWHRVLEAVVDLEESGKKALGRKLHSESAQLLSAALLDLDLALLGMGEEVEEGLRVRLEAVMELLRRGTRSVGDASRRAGLVWRPDLVESLRCLEVGLGPAQLRLPEEPVELPLVWRLLLLLLVEVSVAALGPEEQELAFLSLERLERGGLELVLTLDPEELPAEALRQIGCIGDGVEFLAGRVALEETGLRLRVPSCPDPKDVGGR